MKNGWRNASFSFWLLIAFLSLVALTGGSARSDVQSLVILRPAAVFVFGIALTNCNGGHLREHKILFGIVAAIWVLLITQLVPLPAAFWHALPGRGLVADISAVYGATEVIRPMSMDSEATRNALFSLFTPTAVLLLAISINKEERFLLLPVLIIITVCSGLWGLLQLTSDPEGSLFYYRTTNNGAAVGFFANRNHQAMLLACLFPMLATFASTMDRSGDKSKIRGGIAIGVGAVAVPLLLVTGSRAGLVIGGLSLLASLILYRTNTALKEKGAAGRNSLLPVSTGIAALLLVGATIWLSRAEAVMRLLGSNGDGDLRLGIWSHVWQILTSYLPWGTGVGSFSTIFKSGEPNDALGFNYVNQAHNDWVDIFVTSGFPGILLLAVAAICLGFAAWSALRARGSGRNVRIAKLGALIVIIYAVGSLADYPLRAPFSAVIFCVAVVWMTTCNKERVEIAGRA